ncbi:MAG TPA: MFS transporter [Steroidobacteraceae bacterium]|nr:MFS transporter [Steroidobacteraceae bacterium]
MTGSPFPLPTRLGRVRRSLGAQATPLIIAVAFFLEEIDATILTTSLPQMARSLGVDAPRMSLAISCYLLSVAIVLPVSGWLSDRIGARRAYCAALGVFAAGSALCGWAPSLPLLLVGRAVQGMGGACMTSVGRLIVVRAVPKEQLLTATNYMIAPALLGSLLGPVVGGFITTYFSWRWNFLINVPLGLLGILVSVAVVPPVARQPARPFDWTGFGMLALSLCLIQLIVRPGGLAGGGPGGYLLAAGVTGGLLAGYVRHARRTPHPLVDIRLLRTRTLAVTVMAGGLARIASGALPFVLPLLLQTVFGLDPLHSGLLTLAATAGAFVSRAGAGAAMRRLSLRTLLVINALVLATLIGGLARFTPASPHAWIFVYLLILGFLRSVQLSTLTALGYADLEANQFSHATTLITLAARCFMSGGIILAAAVLGALAGPHGATAGDFAVVFGILAMLMGGSAIGFGYLRHTDGWQLSRPAGEPPASPA